MTHDTLQLIISIVTVLLGGGFLAALLRTLVQLKKLKLEHEGGERDDARVDFNTILQEVKAQRDEAWAMIEKQNGRMTQMEAEIQGLRLARDLDPFPNWVIDKNGEYLFVNREFERYFLEPRGETYRDVIGKTHDDVWPAEFCKTLRALDAAARSRPDGTARSSTALELPVLGASRVTVHKFPIRFKPSGIIVAYAGFITDIDPERELLGVPV